MKVAGSTRAGARGFRWATTRVVHKMQCLRTNVEKIFCLWMLCNFTKFHWENNCNFLLNICFLAGSNESEPLLFKRRQQCLRRACVVQRIPARRRTLLVFRDRGARANQTRKNDNDYVFYTFVNVPSAYWSDSSAPSLNDGRSFSFLKNFVDPGVPLFFLSVRERSAHLHFLAIWSTSRLSYIELFKINCMGTFKYRFS